MYNFDSKGTLAGQEIKPRVYVMEEKKWHKKYENTKRKRGKMKEKEIKGKEKGRKGKEYGE